jgi:hypothetical protein
MIGEFKNVFSFLSNCWLSLRFYSDKIVLFLNGLNFENNSKYIQQKKFAVPTIFYTALHMYIALFYIYVYSIFYTALHMYIALHFYYVLIGFFRK